MQRKVYWKAVNQKRIIILPTFRGLHKVDKPHRNSSLVLRQSGDWACFICTSAVKAKKCQKILPRKAMIL